VSTIDALVKEQESIAFPKKSFDLGCGPPAEEKERIGDEEIYMESILDYGRK